MKLKSSDISERDRRKMAIEAVYLRALVRTRGTPSGSVLGNHSLVRKSKSAGKVTCRSGRKKTERKWQLGGLPSLETPSDAFPWPLGISQ